MAQTESAASTFRRRFAASLAEEKRLDSQALGAVISVEAALWMAVAPSWTVPLARDARFPSDNPDSAFEKMVELQRAEVWRSPEDVPFAEPVYTLTAAARAEALNSQEPAAVLMIAEAAATGIYQANIPLQQIPPDTQRWASLARLIRDRESMEEEFIELVEEHVRTGDTAEALRLIDVARPIASLLSSALDNHMNLALQQAARHIELMQRAAHDRSRLRTFVERKAQTEAFRSFMTGESGAWALHYLGSGGAGKTMLIRHLACDIAPAEFQAAVARVDFDYLNPDYPFQSPGLLLWSLAEELRAYDRKGRASRFFDRARVNLELLHQRLRGIRNPSSRPSDDPMVAEACAYYADAFRALERPVILIADTCEELAKVRPENVDETFRILSLLQKQYRELKVIFAGRRLLASGGFGWRTRAQVEQPLRPDLALSIVEGFSEEEASEFLDQRMKVQPWLWNAIKSQARWKGGSPYQIEYTGERPAPQPGPRYQPFELRFFAEWAVDDPNLDASTISSASVEQYVQIRILRRLRDPALEKLLPGVALLRHFDRDSLQRIGLEHDEDAFDKLRQQDWISGRTITGIGNEGARTVLDADNATCDRLEAYYEATDSGFRALKIRARDYLQDQTLNGDLGTLDWPMFDSTLRLFSNDPLTGIAWWETVERRIAKERGYAWLLTVARGLLGEGGAVEVDSPFYLPVITSEALACEKVNAPREALNRWEEVFRLSDSDAPARIMRARAHRLSLAAKLSMPIDSEELLSFLLRSAVDPHDLDKQATFINFAESLVERAEIMPYTEVHELQRSIGASKVDGPLFNSFLYSLWARLLVLRGNLLIADTLFQRAIEFAEQVETTPEDIPDWSPPADPLARVRLEQLRGLYPAGRLEERHLSGSPTDYPGSANVDQDRLRSAQLLMALAQSSRSVVKPSLVEYEPICNAHRETPPYFVAASAAFMATGHFDQALEILDPVFKNPSSYSLPSLQGTVLQQLRIFRRMRKAGSHSAGVGFKETTPAILRELWAINALNSVQETLFVADDAATVHAMWQTAETRSHPKVDQLVILVKISLIGLIKRNWEGGSADEVAIALDLYEAMILAQRNLLTFSLEEIKLGLRSAQPAEWWLYHSSEPEQALRIWVRTHALLGDVNDPPNSLLERLGHRRAAEIALDEGELLSLRLPDLSVSIFDVALRSFRFAKDNVGVFLTEVLRALMGNSTLSSVRHAYEAACQTELSDLNLQTWDQLEAMAQATHDFHVDALLKGEWGPWLLRVVHLIGRGRNSQLHDTYDGLPMPTDFLPAGFTYNLSFPKLSWEKVTIVVSLVFGVSLLFAALVFGYFLFTRVTRSYFHVDVVSSWNRLALYLVVLTVPVYLVRLRPRTTVAVVVSIAGLLGIGFGPIWLNTLPQSITLALLSIIAIVVVCTRSVYYTVGRFFMSRSRLDLEVALKPDHSIHVRFRRWNFLSKYLLDARRDMGYLSRQLALARSASIAFQYDFGSEYSQIWAQSPKRMRTDLASAADLLQNRPIEVTLTVSPELDEPCWEALFNAPREPLGNFQFRRSRTGRKARSRISHPAVTTILCDEPSAIQPAREAWGIWRGGSRLSETSILHLVGSVQKGSTANIVKIAGQRSSFTADELLRLYPEVALCVVQCEPTLIPSSERTSSDRLEAADTRRFCGELFDKGIDAVLAVPPLTAQVVTGIIRYLAELMWAEPPDGELALLQAVHNMKRMVSLEGGTSGYERSLDLCLFLADGWQIPHKTP